jgi:hypothetical protein
MAAAAAHQWRDALGRPREGIHSYRLFDIAVVDVIMTIAASVAIARAFDWNLCLVTLAAFALGVSVHRAMGVNTALNVRIFGNV